MKFEISLLGQEISSKAKNRPEKKMCPAVVEPTQYPHKLVFSVMVKERETAHNTSVNKSESE